MHFFNRRIDSEIIDLRLKKIVATITYAPADRFFRIELSRVFGATIYGKTPGSHILYRISYRTLYRIYTTKGTNKEKAPTPHNEPSEG